MQSSILFISLPSSDISSKVAYITYTAGGTISFLGGNNGKTPCSFEKITLYCDLTLYGDLIHGKLLLQRGKR